MGLFFQGVPPVDQTHIRLLMPEVMRYLRSISSGIYRGQYRDESQRWFGDSSPEWMAMLASQLNTMASVVNVERITVGFRRFNHREAGTFALATVPRGGWQTFNNVGEARNRNFQLWLDRAWDKAPLYRTKTNHDSKFQTLVHEFTHMILDTDDVKGGYGSGGARRFAALNPGKAQKNADNWGYFVEYIRYHETFKEADTDLTGVAELFG